jgi:GNAT superfamily N-acetyltransferase
VLRLVPTPLSSPVARDLERRMSDDIVVRYGGEEFEPPMDAGVFEAPHGCFVVAFLEADGGDLVPVGCAGIRRHDEAIAELKRMYVADEARGRGIARAILERLEEEAVALGYSTMWLETGTEQPEAISLYESHGYEPIPNYGSYKDDPRSRCFARRLT